MKKVDFNFEIKGGLNEMSKPLVTKANESLANLLETSHQTDAVKILQYYNWALELKTGGFLMECKKEQNLEIRCYGIEEIYCRASTCICFLQATYFECFRSS